MGTERFSETFLGNLETSWQLNMRGNLVGGSCLTHYSNLVMHATNLTFIILQQQWLLHWCLRKQMSQTTTSNIWPTLLTTIALNSLVNFPFNAVLKTWPSYYMFERTFLNNEFSHFLSRKNRCHVLSLNFLLSCTSFSFNIFQTFPS